MQHHRDENRTKLSAAERHILKARPEAAILAWRHFGQIGRARAIFAAKRQALQHSRDEQGRRAEQSGDRVSRRDRDQHRPAEHQRDRQRQPRLAPARVGKAAHHPCADRAHDEADGKDCGGVQKLRGGVGLREKDRGEINGKGGVSEPVIPFDQIAHRAADDRNQPFARYRQRLHPVPSPLFRHAGFNRASGFLRGSWTPDQVGM